jgi:hypothetical protein
MIWSTAAASGGIAFSFLKAWGPRARLGVPILSRKETGEIVTASLPDLLAESFPPLARYCPNLPTISEQQGLFVLLPVRRPSTVAPPAEASRTRC